MGAVSAAGENGNPALLEKAYRDGTCLAETEYNLEIIKAFPDSDIRKKKDLVLYHFVIENIAAEYLEEHQISLEAVIRGK